MLFTTVAPIDNIMNTYSPICDDLLTFWNIKPFVYIIGRTGVKKREWENRPPPCYLPTQCFNVRQGQSVVVRYKAFGAYDCVDFFFGLALNIGK